MATNETLPALEAMREAVTTAMNDEIIAVATFLHNELVDRCENAVDMAIDADDRDAMNEALVLVMRVEDVIPHYLGNSNGVSTRTFWRHHQVEERIKEAINYTRSCGRGPRPAPPRHAVEQPSFLDPAVWRRQRKEEEKALASLELDEENVVAALASSAADGPVHVADVVDAMLEAARVKPAVAGRIRQRVSARITAALVRRERSGEVVRHRPADSRGGRVTCRWEAARDGA